MADRAVHSDIVIVGAGSAGSVVAEQLSRDEDCRVTVLEAGVGLTDVLAAQVADGSQLPIGAASPLVRRYRAELTTESASAMTIVRGATAGGSGAVNGGYFCRGRPGDFDAASLPGWTWGDVLAHYRAIETDLDFDGPEHGDSGPIRVRRVGELSGASAVFAAGAQKAGFSWIADLNAMPPGTGEQAGVGPVPLNIVDGVRTGPGSAYLIPALARDNLTLLTETRAVRIEIAAGRVVGLRAIGPGGEIAMTAERVVVCAGAIESAHLLMLSGLGDEAMLNSAGVAVVAALPVGANVADHPEWVLPVDWTVSGGRPPLEVVLHTDDGLEIRPYTGGFIAMVGDTATGRPDWPHIGVALMRPRARGRLSLLSADPDVAPRIELRYDSDPADIAALRGGVQLVRELIAGEVEVGHPIWSTSQHLCGSAPMGTEADETAVLDPRCRVRGVDGLWVIDGSALPTIPSRGPHATIVMLAHRAAEFVVGR
ncbi:MAG TPA: mycofactocin system GMC family oxidoreductase MftG [Mycobacterium sp.]|nr:mycofactocin system GMC family oxidoreductase MftG [Mycobacterium sp.]